MRYYDYLLKGFVEPAKDVTHLPVPNQIKHIEKDFPTEHYSLLRDPSDFDRDTFRRIAREYSGKMLYAIQGKLKGSSEYIDQAVRYPALTWKEYEAWKHHEDSKGSAFEPASTESQVLKFHSRITKVQDTDGNLFVEGIASNRSLDRDEEVVETDAIKNGIAAFLSNPILLWMHMPSFPIGKIVNMEISDEIGFWVRAYISKAKDTEDICIKIIEEIIRAFSIGFWPIDGKLLNDIWHIIALELWELSIVSIPSNRESLFNVAKAAQYGTDLVVPERSLSAEVDKIVSLKIIKALKGKSINHEPETGQKVIPAPEYANLQQVLGEIESKRRNKELSRLRNL